MAGKTLDDEDLIHHLAEEEEEEDVEEEEEHADRARRRWCHHHRQRTEWNPSSYTYGRAVSHQNRLGRRLINADEADGEVGDYRPQGRKVVFHPHVLKRG